MTVRIEQTVSYEPTALFPIPSDAPETNVSSIHRVVEITDDQAKGEKGRTALMKLATDTLRGLSGDVKSGPGTAGPVRELGPDEVLGYPLGQKQR